MQSCTCICDIIGSKLLRATVIGAGEFQILHCVVHTGMVRRDITSYKQVHASSSPLDRAESYCQDKGRRIMTLPGISEAFHETTHPAGTEGNVG